MDAVALDFESVELEVECSWEAGESNGGEFAIIGPLNVVEQLAGMGVAAHVRIGKLSPKARVTLEGTLARKSAGIPLDAATFCHLQSAPSMINLDDQLMALQLSRNDWAFVLLLGGFAYFDEAGVLLQVTALSLTLSHSSGRRTGMIMEGTKVENQEAVLAGMERQGRLAQTLNGWQEGGLRKICWVHPSELINGKTVCDTPYPHGGMRLACSVRLIFPFFAC